MNHMKSNRFIKYIVTSMIGFLISISVLELQGYREAVELTDQIRMISNAYTIPGMLLIMLGCLVWLSNEGAFLGPGYVLSYLVDRLIPGGRAVRKDEKYYDYVQRKKSKERAPFLFLLITGGLFLAVAMITLVMFYRVQ